MISFVMVKALLEKRQPGDSSAQSYDTSLIVRWAIFVALVVFVLALLLAYSHARRRMLRGLPPKAYHKWMVRNQQHAGQTSTIQNQFSFYRAEPTEYDLEACPPPVYDPNHVPPPLYQPPTGASKANPSQDYDVPPPGPPPISVPATVEQPEETIVSPPPMARSSGSRWLSKIRRST